MIDTKHKKAFLNQINGKITRSSVINQKSINNCGLCYQFSKDGTDSLFGNLRINDVKYEPYFPSKGKIISCGIKI